ncbi:MAG: hypothetical protein AVDCRST_MAG93-6659, partial [uncultured Chloroflexia bacterium]
AHIFLPSICFSRLAKCTAGVDASRGVAAVKGIVRSSVRKPQPRNCFFGVCLPPSFPCQTGFAMEKRQEMQRKAYAVANRSHTPLTESVAVTVEAPIGGCCSLRLVTASVTLGRVVLTCVPQMGVIRRRVLPQ